MTGWRIGTFGVVGWPQGREGEALDTVVCDWGPRKPEVLATVDGPDGRYVLAKVAGHSTFASVGHRRYEPTRLYLLAVEREARPDYSYPVYEGRVVTSIAPGRGVSVAPGQHGRKVADSLWHTAKALAAGQTTEDAVRQIVNEAERQAAIPRLAQEEVAR